MKPTTRSAAMPAPAQTWLGHPPGLFVLFLTEMWERFSFYGMRALLIFYVTQHFLFERTFGQGLYATYASMVYLMPLFGGLLADRFLGMRKAVSFGAVLLVLGHFGMAFEGPPAREFIVYDGARYAVTVAERGNDTVPAVAIDGVAHPIAGAQNGLRIEAPPAGTLPALLPAGSYERVVERDPFHVQIFYLSLALIIIGVGFLKPNISTVVGALYEPGDPRRDGGFTIFYMGINIGAAVATLLCGWLGQTFGWAYGFGAAGFGMLFGLITFRRGQHLLAGRGGPPAPERLAGKTALGVSMEGLIYAGALLGVVAVWRIIQHQSIVGYLLAAAASVFIVGLLGFSILKCSAVERDRMLVAMALTGFSVLFWTLFEQAGSSLNEFALNNTDLEFFGLFTLTASQTQSFNPIFIILFAPLFSALWTWAGRRGRDLSTPAKFALALVQVGLGFLVLVYGAVHAGADAQVALVWLILAYLLHTTGELCLSPIGLSMITKLAVWRVMGLMMGVWFLSSAGAHFLAGQIAKLTVTESFGGRALDAGAQLAAYQQVFGTIGLVALGVGAVLGMLAPLLRKRMHGAG
ncbi:MAG: MFS transporter [Alphaproteobacteria bacterium]|nr:MAG: MFS transporter [Alphaproteobacteria bacterium]